MQWMCAQHVRGSNRVDFGAVIASLAKGGVYVTHTSPHLKLHATPPVPAAAAPVATL